MKKEKSEARSFVARRFKRVPLKVTFRVSGQDLNGNPFEDSAETQEVGGLGGRFTIRYEVRVGATLKLLGPKGFVSLVRVVWTKKALSAERFLIGFQLLEPREDWVVQLDDRAGRNTPKSTNEK